MDNSSISSTSPLTLSWMDIIFFCEVLFTILTFVLYSFQCSFFIGKLKKGFSSFAVLFILTATMFIGDFPVRFLILGIFRSFLETHFLAPSFWLTPTYFLSYYSFHAEFYIATVISLNRLSVFYFPLTYERFFRRNIIFMVVVLLIIPLASTGYLLISQTRIRAHFGGYSIDYEKLIPVWSSNSRNSATVVFLTVPVIALSSLLTLHKYSTTTAAVDKKDTVFMMVSILQCTVLIVYGGIQIFFYFGSNGPLFWTAYTMRRYVSDICITLPSWTLFVMGSEMREHIQSQLCWKPSTESVEPVTVNSQLSSK